MQLQAKQVDYLDEHLIGNRLVAIAPEEMVVSRIDRFLIKKT
ncbi:hypothetical protein QUB77_16375 [Microcoleus sp. AT9b-C3]